MEARRRETMTRRMEVRGIEDIEGRRARRDGNIEASEKSEERREESTLS
jgi:hypothetical protein